MNQNNRRHFNETDFGNKVRLALNEQLEQLPPSTHQRLSQARKLALSRRKTRTPFLLPAFATKLAGGFPSSFNSRFSWANRMGVGMGVALPILVLVIGLVGLYRYEEQQRVNETAEIDALVLSDELPISAYLDHGFSAYLNTHGE
jgi:hypothetical protein